MYTKQFPKSLFIFIFLILVLQTLAIIFYWYWRIPWFDIFMHFLGGVWVGMSVLWLYLFSGKISSAGVHGRVRVFMTTVCAVFLIALLWEIFEYIIFVLIPHGMPYNMPDTLGDILAGVLGGAFAATLIPKQRLIIEKIP